MEENREIPQAPSQGANGPAAPEAEIAQPAPAATPEVPAASAPPPTVPQAPEKGAAEPSGQVIASGRREGDRAFGVGRRKTAVARVIISPGAGRISIDGREVEEYFRRRKLIDEVNMPFVLTGTTGRFDMTARVRGSSLAAQAGAVRLALARALAAWQPEYRPPLAVGRMLTRDPRMVERKKYGIRGARRRPQWTKR